MAVSWNASDADNHSLTYMVPYSANMGGTWETLKAGYGNKDIVLDTGLIPGSESGDSILVRVIASDGVNTASGTSAPFTVSGHAPIVVIDHPGEGESFAQGTAVMAAASAFDAEDGPLAPSSIAWSLDGEDTGQTGREFYLPQLRAGFHTLTVEATDSEGTTVEQTVRFAVRAPDFEEVQRWRVF